MVVGRNQAVWHFSRHFSEVGGAVAPVQVSLDVLTSAIVGLIDGSQCGRCFLLLFSLSHNDSAKIYDNR